MKTKLIIATLTIFTCYGQCVWATKPLSKKENVATRSVQFDNTVWTAENLNISTFRNGDKIAEAESDSAWARAGREHKPAWCYYKGDSSLSSKFGKLYNWYAVNDSRGLAPQGWHIPSDKEWKSVTTFLGEDEKTGYKMKSTFGWAKNGNGNNSSGFSAMPAGNRSENGSFLLIGYYTYFWSATQYDANNALNCYVYYNDSNIHRDHFGAKNCGFSVRCVKDAEYQSTPEATNKSIQIGDQVWTSENLGATAFSNGDVIPEAQTPEEWKKAFETHTPAWCYYKGDSAIGGQYGKLYNWYAVNDSRGLAPKGWRIPTKGDFNALTNYLGDKASIKIRSANGWVSKDNLIGNNSSGFGALPAGFRSLNKAYTNIGLEGRFWTATEDSKEYALAFCYVLLYNTSDFTSVTCTEDAGYSVRCIKNVPN